MVGYLYIVIRRLELIFNVHSSGYSNKIFLVEFFLDNLNLFLDLGSNLF